MSRSSAKKSYEIFTASQLNEVPFEGSWTAGQVAEHIMKSNKGIIEQALNGKTVSVGRPFDEEAELVKNVFRSKEKMISATFLEPSDPPHQLDDILSTLKQQKAQQLEIVNN